MKTTHDLLIVSFQLTAALLQYSLSLCVTAVYLCCSVRLNASYASSFSLAPAVMDGQTVTRWWKGMNRKQREESP